MGRCPRGLVEPECVFTQPPERVVALALDALTPLTGDVPIAADAGDSTFGKGGEG
jgi:hypothetical protein